MDPAVALSAGEQVVLRLRLRAPAEAASGSSLKRSRAARGAGPPPGVDDEVWSALPPEVQAELLEAVRAAASEADSEGDEVEVVERRPSTAGKVPRMEDAPSSSCSSAPVASPSSRAAQVEPLTTLTWNVWFSELQQRNRMRGVCETLARERPRFLALQEVTLPILELLRPQLVQLGYDVRVQNPCDYFCALAVRDAKWETVRELPFANSIMGRCLLYGRTTLPGVGSVLVATTHLESPMPRVSMYTTERQAQLASCFKTLGEAIKAHSPQPSAVFLMGDLNWTEGGRPRRDRPSVLTEVRDGAVPLPNNWRDVWEATHAGLDFFESCTYNSSTNRMLSGSLSYRADRVLFWGPGMQPRAARMVGTEPLEGVTHVDKRGKVKPVYCSDHYGVLASFGFGLDAAH
jgi:tyrosyl-DNA phosphodiesterase 2